MYMNIPPTFSRFPVAGKRPLVDWGRYITKLPTKEEIIDWERRYKDKTGWGIATGPVSGILVLDDDGGLDVKKYPIPKTWTVKTPRGGTHYYFKWTHELNDKVTTKTSVIEKVDVRGSGGFVVFYGWQNPTYMLPLSVPPRWLIDLLPDKGHSQTANNYSETANKSQLQELMDEMAPYSHNRNDHFARIAGSLRGRGYTADDIFVLLSPKATEVDFSLSELKTVCKSVSRYAPNERIDETQALSIDQFLKDQEKVEWICEGMIAKKSIVFFAGLPETGKTWAAIDLAIECAKGGGLWLGKFPVNKAKVLFVDQERFKGETQRRFNAVIHAKDSLLPDGLSKNLFIKTGTTTRLNLQNSFEAFRKELAEIKPELVIIDSFVTIHTKEENNRKDIQEVLEKVKELRNEFGCTFVFLHHENKMAFDKEQGDPSISQMAGSIAIPAVAETVFTVRRHDAESSMVYMTKSTLGPTISPFLFKVIDLDESKSKISVVAY